MLEVEPTGQCGRTARPSKVVETATKQSRRRWLRAIRHVAALSICRRRAFTAIGGGVYRFTARYLLFFLSFS